MFGPARSRAATAYRQVGVQSMVDGASPHRLIQMLFEGLMQSLNAARGALQRGEIEEKGRLINKSCRILEEGLKASLDPSQGEIASNLSALYDYCNTRLMLANARNDVTLIDEVVSLVAPIADGWSQIAPAQAEGA